MTKRIKCRARVAYPRLDHFLTDVLDGISRGQVEKLIHEGRVTLDDRPATRKSQAVGVGAVAEVEINGDETVPYVPSATLVKLFEDEWLLAIDKAAGMTVHPGAGETGETVLDIFRFHYPQIAEIKNKQRPGIVHRLDRDTSGVLLLAKDEETMTRMQQQFAAREVQKTYLALVKGAMRFRNGTIDLPLQRDPRRPTRFIARRADSSREETREAITDYSVILQLPAFSLLRVEPRTGRTHQIRVHLTAQGNPVLGDSWYGRHNSLSYPGLALHAAALVFTHPHSGLRLKIAAPMPSTMSQYICRELTARSKQSV